MGKPDFGFVQIYKIDYSDVLCSRDGLFEKAPTPILPPVQNTARMQIPGNNF